jgi:hypothetical protein
VGGWKGDTTFPDHLPLSRERIVVKLVGFLTQVKLGGTIDPHGHESDVERARSTAIELVQANLVEDERATETQIAATLAVATAVATRFLESVWDVVNQVAAELIAAKPEYVEVNELVVFDDLRARYEAAERGVDESPGN